MKDIRINISKYPTKNGEGIIAILMYNGKGDPKIALDNAVREFVKDESYLEMIDANLDNPWTRVILTKINDIEQKKFNPEKHNLLTL